MPTSRTPPKFTVLAWMRPAPLKPQPPSSRSSAGCMSVPKWRPRPTGTVQSHCTLNAWRTLRGWIGHAAEVLAEVGRAVFQRVLVAAADLEPAREAPPQFDLQGVVTAERVAGPDVVVVGVRGHIRVDDEEVRRVAGLGREAAPRGVAVEIVGRVVRIAAAPGPAGRANVAFVQLLPEYAVGLFTSRDPLKYAR